MPRSMRFGQGGAASEAEGVKGERHMEPAVLIFRKLVQRVGASARRQ